MGNSRIRAFYFCFFLMTALTLFCSFWLPMYIDDVMYPITTARAGYDGWRIIGVVPQCKQNFDTPIGLLLFPGRLISWLSYYPINTPGMVRLWGVGTLVAWTLGFAWMCRKCGSGMSWRAMLALTVSLNFIGVLPFMATITRPETFMALAVAFFALVPFYKGAREGKAHYALLGMYLLVASWLFATHPKTLFFAPLGLYSMWRIRRPGLVGWVSMGLVLGIVFQAYQFSAYRNICPGDLFYQTFMARAVLDPQQLFDDPAAFMTWFIHGLRTSVVYVQVILFAKEYTSGWLPMMEVMRMHAAANMLIWAMILGIMAFWAVSFGKISVVAWKTRGFLKPDFVVPVLLLAGMVLTTAFKLSKNFYDVIMVWFVGDCLTMIFLMNRPALTSGRAGKVLLGAVMGVSFLCQGLMVYTYWNLDEVNRGADINGVIKDQYKSVSILDYDVREKRIVDFAAKCHIRTKNNNHLIVDMFTYLPFKASYKPVYVEHLRTNLLAFARSTHSTGLVTLCRSLPLDHQKRSVQEEGLCCMSRRAFYSR